MRWCALAVVPAVAAGLAAAADLNPIALRIVGQVKGFANGLNLVEGRELNGPQGLAIDLSANRPELPYPCGRFAAPTRSRHPRSGFANIALASDRAWFFLS